MASPTNAPLVPSLTGNPQFDTFLGYTASKLGMAAAAASITWMDAHGWDTKALAKDVIDLSTLIVTAVTGAFMAAAAWIWGQYRTKWSQAAIVNNTVQAALTGQVPMAVIAKASLAQAEAVEQSPRASTATVPPAPPAPDAVKPAVG